MYEVFEALCDEYTYRYGKVHQTDKKLRQLLRNPPSRLEDNGFEEPPQCMPEEYKTIQSSIQAYRNYYRGAKAYMAKWTKRDTPHWMECA